MCVCVCVCVCVCARAGVGRREEEGAVYCRLNNWQHLCLFRGEKSNVKVITLIILSKQEKMEKEEEDEEYD